MVLLKKYIIYSMVVIGLIIIVSFLMTPFWGNPIAKVGYYFQAHQYLLNRYGYGITVGWTDYDLKQSQYFVPAKAPKYDNVGFRIHFERQDNKVIITDDLCRMKWNNDIKAELAPIVEQVYGGFKTLSTSIQSYCLDEFTEIPYYFDVMDYVGGDVYISIVLERDYSNSELNNVYTIYKSVEVLNPFSFSVSYNNKSFRVTNTDGRSKIHGASDLLNYSR